MKTNILKKVGIFALITAACAGTAGAMNNKKVTLTERYAVPIIELAGALCSSKNYCILLSELKNLKGPEILV